ncbi:ABC transporter ATP-binding protein [Spirochaeta cellobiosiphila]|uniref:ABC transporter ATP-binding protein n=1 Tax=Spirochaeta cellobiosiphila TaxID=504483 RepID=UPI000425D3C3|nr:sn-glycerol-3-phosphate ABC transporter ATP-binding protein UgpC [Spirochaeta cellobiosiphila]
MAEVILNDITKVYDGGVKAVDKANIHINDEEFVVLVGPSGCGKTTTLRMVAGLEDITDGELTIDGKRMNEVAPKDRDIAMVFQNYALYPHMSVYDNMAFGLRIRKYAKEEIDSRVKEAAQILDIEQLLERKPKALSGGQRQRVAVGRAIVRKPKVFLFDEPLSNLDAKLRVQMRAEISGLHTRLQATMIYVTHDQTEAMTMGDKIVVMKDGLIQQIGTPLGLYNQPYNRFVAGFIGSPPMNILSGEVLEENGKVVVNEGTFKIETTEKQSAKLKEYVGKQILFGIRPEEFKYQATPAAKNNIKATVEVIEPLGNETHLYVSTESHQMITRVEPDVLPSVGDEVNFTADLNRVLFFDMETEITIQFD